MVLRWSGTNCLTLVSRGLATMALVGYKVTCNHWDPYMVLRWSGTNWLTLVSRGLATMALVGYKVTCNHWDPYHGTEMVWD